MREMPWPCEDADFYRHDRKSKYRINLKCSGEISKQFHKFSDNFFCAAHAITEYILDRRRIGELDLFFFPLAYMYRHSLELKMKAIAFQYLETGEEKQFINDTFHNLTEILSWLEPYICGKIAIDGESFLWMKALFVDMEPIDKESDAFRYPFRIVERKDTLWATKHYEIKKFFDGQKNINLVSFANKMELSYEILNSYYYKREQAFKEHNEMSTLFLEEGGAYYGQSVIEYDYHRDFYGPMVRGYSQVGELLAKWIEEDSDNKDIYFWPMCYVFRNNVELELKQIWFEECNEVFSVKCKKLYKCKHSYYKMWQLINSDLISVCLLTALFFSYIKS